jgi:hypothetical protein
LIPPTSAAASPRCAGGFIVAILKELAKGLLKQKITEISGVSL